MPKNIQAWLVGIIALGMAVVACGGSSPNSPGTPGSGSGPSCRTAAKTQRSVQTFVSGQVVTTDTSCVFNGSTEIICSNVFVDNIHGSGTGTQTTRFASKADIIDEAAVNPPLMLSLGTTTLIESVGVFIITATNSYDAQKRLIGTTITNPPPLGESNFTYSAWDTSGRPTAGMQSLPLGPSGPISITYDDAAHTVMRNIPPNICTVTHDQNGIMIQEECTGTDPSTTVVTILDSQQICK